MEKKASSRNIPKARELLALGCSFLVVLLIAGLSYTTWIQLRRSREQLETWRAILQAETALLSALKDAETGQRGFLLTGNLDYLEPYRKSLSDVGDGLSELTVAASKRTDQTARVKLLTPLVREKLDELKRSIELRQSGQPEAALSLVITGQGKAVMDEIRRSGAQIATVAYERLSEYDESVRSHTYRLAIISTAGGGTLFILLILATATIQKGIRAREVLIAQTQSDRDWFQTTLASIGDAVISTDMDGRVVFLNGVAEFLTGWRGPDAVGAPVEQVFQIRNEDTGETVENPLVKAIREGCVMGLANHTVLIARDGRSIPIDDSAAPIFGRDGRVTGAVLVFRDVSQRKAVEESLRANEHDLRAANEALVRANDDLQQFAYSASHDLQEPIRNVAVYSQIVATRYHDLLDSEGQQLLGFLTEGGRRLATLINDLLAYTRAGTVESELAEVDATAVLNHALLNLAEAIRESSAVVSSDPLPAVYMIEAHLQQVFQNLIGNALKYRGEEPPLVHVSATDGDGAWRFSVRDNGIGIEPQYKDKIFGVFKRLNHDRRYSGNGIGLAICQRVVERYGGRIWVESESGRGATFFFTVPQRGHSEQSAIQSAAG